MKPTNIVAWILDSGVSIHLTFSKDNFIEYEELEQPTLVVTTANDIYIRGVGLVLLHHKVVVLGISWQCTTHLYPVYYIPKLTARLISLGEFLQQGMSIHGDAKTLSLSMKKVRFPVLQCIPRRLGDNIFWLYASIAQLTNIATIYAVDYDLIHRHFGDPSKNVLKCAQSHTKGFPSITFDNEDSICTGCAEGKMPLTER
jgi:hypothetical protein